MTAEDEEYPKDVDALPDQCLSLPFFRKLRESDRIRDIYIRRYTSREAIDNNDNREIFESSTGLIPTGVEAFLIGREDDGLAFELSNDGWQVVNKFEGEAWQAQARAYIIKPYISISRVYRLMQVEKSFDKED